MRTAAASPRLSWLLAASLATSWFAPREARANGTFPAVSQLVSEPGEPGHLALRTTFGLVFSTDAGANWDWVCEDALGYVNTLPAVAVLAGGPMVLGVPNGITHGRLGGCDFALAHGADGNVVDLSVVRGTSNGVIALSVDFAAHSSQLWESSDAGATFTRVGSAWPDFIATTLDAAPSDPNVIYVSGMPFQSSGAQGLLLRSADRGKTFVAQQVPDSVGLAWPYIAAIDPDRPAKVYLRLADVPGRLKVTEDGGATFSEPLQIDYELQGFALSPDGKTVVVSSPAAGTFRASSEALQFEKVACSGVSCLLWNSAGLYACGDQSIHGYVVGRSLDQGASFERVLDFSCIRSDSGCSAASSVGAVCPALWPPIAMQLAGFGECGANAPPPVFTDCLTSGGSSTATGGANATPMGGTAASGGASSIAGTAPGGSTKSSSNSGCQFSRAPMDPSAVFGLAALACGFTCTTGRRRARRQREQS